MNYFSCTGAEIFAKRRKRSEKWVVDKEQYQTPSTPGGFGKSPNFPNTFDNGANENSKFTSLPPSTSLPTPTQTYEPKPFYNPFTLDLSLESLPPPKIGELKNVRDPLRNNSTFCRQNDFRASGEPFYTVSLLPDHFFHFASKTKVILFIFYLFFYP